jgi:SWI/SNF related-matrix-associated actin-dependent regulator of chromatin subfamily C
VPGAFLQITGKIESYYRSTCCVSLQSFRQDSRDNWGTLYPPDEKEPPEFGEELDRPDVFRVSVKWLIDMEDYNELMNEEDYEVDEKGAVKVNELDMTYDEFSSCEEKPKKKAKKRGRSPSPSQSKKKGKG